MELLVILVVFLAVLAAIVLLIGAAAGAVISAGYYLTFPALGLITAIVAAIWGVVYYRAPWCADMNRYGQRAWYSKRPKSEILFRGYVIGAVLAAVWAIAFFANWSGTGGFFDTLV